MATKRPMRRFHPNANGWYVGANIQSKPRVLMPYVGGFTNCDRICKEIVAEGYRGSVSRRPLTGFHAFSAGIP